MLGKRDFGFVIHTVGDGFFDGFNRPVALGSAIGISAVTAWIAFAPGASTEMLGQAKALLLQGFRGWFLYSLGGFTMLALVIAMTPVAARLRLARDDARRPSFSTASWLSMMFCAGIGGGIVIYAVAEPMSHFTVNPELMRGSLEPGGTEAARAAVKYSFLHWGLSAWACYAVMGLSLGLFSYRYGLPLTIRTVVAPLLGRRLSGYWGHLIDIFAIVAIVAGIATTMGYGVKTLSSGLNFLAGGMLIHDAPNHLPVLLTALGFSAGAATFSLISGVSRGLKWMSNLGTGLFFAVMVFFMMNCAPGMLAFIGFGAFADYITQLPSLSLSVFADVSTPEAEALSTWQTDWTIFYWTWWLAFAPFVSLFIARISEGRTVREFILGSALAPCGVCFAWFACTGTATISLEMGSAEDLLLGRAPSEKLFAAISFLNAGFVGRAFAWAAIVLMFFLATVTLASGVLAITTVAAAGDNAAKPTKHIVLWSVVATMTIGALLAAGGTASIRDEMVISALPLSVIIALAAISVVWVLIVETRTRARDDETTRLKMNAMAASAPRPWTDD